MRTTLERDGKKVTATHLLLGREEVFDHGFRIEAFDRSGGPLDFQLDVYEFFWAPLTQGKASFAQVVRWLVAAGFTPLRRFAYNVPLLVRCEKNRNNPRKQCLEFARELWRIVYVLLAAALLAGSAATLIYQSTELAKKLPAALQPALLWLTATTWTDAAKGVGTAVAALVAAIAAFAVLLSIPKQIGDLLQLRKRKPRAARTSQAEKTFLPGLLNDTVRRAQSLWAKINEEREQWGVEYGARILFVLLSAVALPITAGVVYWLSLPSPGCIGPVCPVPVVHHFYGQLPMKELVIVIPLLVFAFALKRVFIDYLADIALYTTADENSEFFKTRTAILNEATHRIRSLLQDPQYASVAIAGHSLGSVIAYDAISWLRTEAQLPRVDGARETINKLATLAKALPTDQAATANALLDRLKPAAISPITPITAGEFGKLTTFITFGSPLNKVLYFFRTRVKVYETVRSHIIQELHGFRQLPDLLTRDPDIVKAPLEQIPDRLYWLNIYSPMDPVSAKLEFYENVHDRRRWYPWPGICHVDYWRDEGFYREVLDALRRRDASEALPTSTLATPADGDNLKPQKKEVRWRGEVSSGRHSRCRSSKSMSAH